MSHVGLVSCVSKKREHAAEAKDLYQSALFIKCRRFVERNCDKWFILSAKYGLVDPFQVIEPYEESLNTKSRKERESWAEQVWSVLRRRLTRDDRVTILAGERYREELVSRIAEHGCHVDIPMRGLSIGRQLEWLSREQDQTNCEPDVERLYKALRRLQSGIGGKRLLSECTGRLEWPNKGVYLFFEPGELRLETAESRVVRVGTHAVRSGSKATLWNRLRTHRGTGAGHGNHRGSIFRLHVGAALAAREPALSVRSWSVGQSASPSVREAERQLEQRVSAHIGAMSVLWLAVEDEASPSSDRAYLERHLIGTLAGKDVPTDPPSPQWLGLSSVEERIRQRGLWNLDFLDYRCSPDYLDVLDQYVLITIGKMPRPSGPIAPHDWYSSERLEVPHRQR